MHNTSPYYDLTSNSQRKGLVNELFLTSGLLNDTDTGQSFSFSVSDVMNKEIIEQLHIGQFVVFHPRGASAQIMSVLSTKKARKYAPIDIKWDEAKKRNFFFCGNFLVHERVNFKIENRDMVSFLYVLLMAWWPEVHQPRFMQSLKYYYTSSHPRLERGQ